MKPSFIEQKIFDIRGQKVMLSFHLAELYDVDTKAFNQAIKRNAFKFPRDFMFQLNKKEWDFLRSQNVTLEIGRGKYPKYLPYAFTEHGVTMAASILKSKKAVRMNIMVVRAFVAFRQFSIKHGDLLIQLKNLRQELHDRLGEHDVQLAAIYDAIENLLDEKAENKNWEQRRRIGFRRKTEN